MVAHDVALTPVLAGAFAVALTAVFTMLLVAAAARSATSRHIFLLVMGMQFTQAVALGSRLLGALSWRCMLVAACVTRLWSMTDLCCVGVYSRHDLSQLHSSPVCPVVTWRRRTSWLQKQVLSHVDFGCGKPMSRSLTVSDHG